MCIHAHGAAFFNNRSYDDFDLNIDGKKTIEGRCAVGNYNRYISTPLFCVVV